MAVIATQSNYSMGQHRSNSEKPETYCSSIETININEGFAIKDSEKNDEVTIRGDGDQIPVYTNLVRKESCS